MLLLLHGFPSSSAMFAPLMPLLADRYRVIAPDFPGFGHSDCPSPDTFPYTFDSLTEYVGGLLHALDVSHYTLYLHDYGGPIGFRLALQDPERVSALIVQNAVAHAEGLSPAWDVRKQFWADRAAYEPKIRAALHSPEVARQRHLSGAADEAAIDPDKWKAELAFLTRPGMDRIQLDLMYDYQSNVASYPEWQAYLRQRQPRTLVIWGRHDPVFTEAGAMAFGRELRGAELHLLNAGHFVLDEKLAVVAGLIRRFLSANAA